MRKVDIAILAVLVVLLMSWSKIDSKFIKPFFPAKETEIIEETEPGTSLGADVELSETPASVTGETVTEESGLVAEAAETVAEPEPAKPVTLEPETVFLLQNTNVVVEISSRGAAINAATLLDFRADNTETSGPVVLEFEPVRSLVYRNLEGLDALSDFEMLTDDDEQMLVLRRQASSGLSLQRVMMLDENYILHIKDEFSNQGDRSVTLEQPVIELGSMGDITDFQMRGMVNLGVDSLSPGGKVQHWGKKIKGFFGDARKEENLAKLPKSIEHQPHEEPVDWVAVKNKYFVQILTPQGGGDGFMVKANRTLDPRETEDPSFSPKFKNLDLVGATITLPTFTLEPGQTRALEMLYYVGPKEYSELIKTGMRHVDVMEFGMWGVIGKLLLRLMNFLYRVVWPHNYGIAIILVTILIRIVFWPITHKSTQSMKRMAEIQPLMKEIQEKYKDDKQKQQQEMMALYKEHKVNPVGGCLPMIIQIPVFIALFVVLRSAIELRFASFLWIPDLSMPENLFAGKIPIAGSLNILPLIMTGMMALQQKLQPTSGDPQQAKMMMFMPVMMLVIFYSMPSGLVLYWTTNQCLMIIQQLMIRRQQAKKAA